MSPCLAHEHCRKCKTIRSFLLPRHALTFLARLRQADGDRLLAALHLAAAAALAAFGRAAFVAAHFLLDVAPRPGGVFALSLLRHGVLLTMRRTPLGRAASNIGAAGATCVAHPRPHQITGGNIAGSRMRNSGRALRNWRGMQAIINEHSLRRSPRSC